MFFSFQCFHEAHTGLRTRDQGGFRGSGGLMDQEGITRIRRGSGGLRDQRDLEIRDDSGDQRDLGIRGGSGGTHGIRGTQGSGGTQGIKKNSGEGLLGYFRYFLFCFSCDISKGAVKNHS